MAGGHVQNQLFIQWLSEAHIHQRGVHFIGELLCFRQQCTEVKDSKGVAFTQHAAFPDGQGGEGDPDAIEADTNAPDTTAAAPPITRRAGRTSTTSA